MSKINYELELDSKKTFKCDCCNKRTRTVIGYINHDERTLAAYYVSWVIGGAPNHDATIDLIVGKWDEDSTAADRKGLSLICRWVSEGLGFSTIDATERVQADGELVGYAYKRDEVVGTPLAQLAYDLVDVIMEKDYRVEPMWKTVKQRRPRKSR